MAKFLTFETTAVKLNDSIFPSNSATFGLQAATVPVFDINGNLIDYAPNGPIQGKFSTEFYLTGALPNYLKFDNQSDAPISVSFNNFNIPSAFLTDLSFSVEPYQPISVSASFDFYHGIISLSTDLNDTHNLFSPADGTNKVKNQLATLNGLSSYIITYDRSTYKENPDDFIVSNFSYSFTVDRQPLLRVKQSIPSRVALKQVNGQFSITSNNIDGLLDIHGNDAIFNAILADPQNPATYTSIGLTGIITDQNYVISDSNYGVGTIKMVQSITKKRNAISVPETNDPAIVEVSPPVPPIDVPGPPIPPIIIVVPPGPIPPNPNPEPPAPELDPSLIWFNIYAEVLKLDQTCSAKGYASEINNIKVATDVDSYLKNTSYLPPVYPDGKIEHYVIKFKNVQTVVKLNRNFDSERNPVPNNYFVCCVGVNKNVLDLNLATPGLNFIEDFNEFGVVDPCYTVNMSANDPERFLAVQAKTTTWVSKYDAYGDVDGCKTEHPNDNLLCASWKIYKNWNSLIHSMQTVRTLDPNLDSYKNPYQIVYPIIS